MCRSARRAGFTLIELLVALAIFTIGALAIVRIFPPALGVIQSSEHTTAGSRMARSILARYDSQPGLVPDGVYDYLTSAVSTNNPSGWNNFSGAVEGTVNRNSSLPAGPRDISGTALDHFKQIIGEKHKVVSDAATPTPKLFVLSRFAYDGPIAISEEDEIKGVTVDLNGQVDFSDARRASNNASFYDPANPKAPPVEWRGDNTKYYVSYRWLENGRLNGVVDELLVIPPDPLSDLNQQYKVFRGRSAPQNTVATGGIKVRVKRLMGTATASGGDDFRGFVALSGSDYASITRDPIPGETISLSYTVKDWRWLINDDSPTRLPENTPASAPDRVVALPVRSIDQDPPTGSPASVYTLLMYTPAGGGNLALDRASWDGGSVTGTRLLNVDAKPGQVIYEAGDLTSPRARTSAWMLDGWVQQIDIAARSYVPYDPSKPRPPNEQEPWREYLWSNGSGVLYFHPSEAGKTVLISYEYEVTPATTKTYKTVISQPVTIEEEITSSGGPAGFEAYVQAVPMADLSGSPIGLSAIRAVQGASVRARTAWIEGDRYMQTTATGYRPLAATS
jgi:prepilin-type N-terminal cleavage/methylation domain-containing protein